MPLSRRIALSLGLALAAAGAGAQGPEADWRTISTPHFRVHFPAETEAWAARTAARLEAVRAAVAEEVGYAPPQIVDVVITDPMAQANGSAWPLLRRPRLVLWTTPPSAASGLGHFADWGELLAVHEIAHLAHLLRPSRNPLRSLAERTVLPVGEMPLKMPRWVIEGYATLLEGRLTGSGRPHSALRAAVLRQWGRQGRLPTFARLSNDSDGFLGMSMAYLAGSAYLEWLEQRAGGESSLRDLWAAATAREGRGFDAAFERVFADRPAALWSRFVAETTAAAIEHERELAEVAREGDIWLDRSGSARALQVSPDGGRVAAIVSLPRRPDRLLVWSLRDERLATPEDPVDRDPEDPPAAARPPRERETVAELEAPPGARLVGARFLPDRERFLVGLLAPDRIRRLRAGLAVWSPQRGLRPISDAADVRDADPLPDGNHALAVRWRDGKSCLVRVDLRGGGVVEMTPPSVELVQDRPRVAPDGSRLAWLEHRDGGWHLRLADVDAEGNLGTAREIRPAREGEPVDLAWRGDGSLLYVVVARGEELDVEALPVEEGAIAHRVTRSFGAALAPAPTPDGEALFYLGLDADGLDIRRLRLDAATLQDPSPPGGDAGEETAGTGVAAAFAAEPPPPSRPYGLGRPEPTLLIGGNAGSGDGALEAGFRLGDLLGRWELVALAADAGPEATRGGSVRFAARPLPATLSLHLARLRDDLGELDAAELAASGSLALGRARVELVGGLGWSRERELELESGTGWLDLAFSSAVVAGRWRLEPGLELDLSRGFGDSDQRLVGAALRLAASAGDWRARLDLDRREASRARDDRERIRLGGPLTSIAPVSARPGRVAHSALPPAALVGDSYDAQRVRLAGRAPVALLVERHRVGDGPWLRLAGLELRWGLPAAPLIGVPALHLDLGAALVDDAGFDRETRWWISLTYPVPPRAIGLPASEFSSSRARR